MELVLLNFPIKAAFRKAFLTPQSSLLRRFCVLLKPTASCFLSKLSWIRSPSPLWSGSSLTFVSIAPALENFDSFPEVPPLCVPCSGSQPTQGHLELSQGLSCYSPFWPSSPGPPAVGEGAVGRGKTSPGFKCCSWNSPIPLLFDDFESWSTYFIIALQLQVTDIRNFVTAMCYHGRRKNKDYTLDAQA